MLSRHPDEYSHIKMDSPLMRNVISQLKGLALGKAVQQDAIRFFKNGIRQ